MGPLVPNRNVRGLVAPASGWTTSLRRAGASLLTLVTTTALALALLAAPGPASADPGDTAVSLGRQIPSAQLTTFTLNVCFCLNAAQAEADIVKVLGTGADVGGFQEFSDLEDRLTLIRVATARDWGWYMPASGGGETIPVVWNRARFRMIDGQTIKVHDAETNVTPARYINVVRLRELATGKVFGIINTHTIAQASFDAQLTDPHRIPRLQLHLRMLRDAITGTFASTEYVFAMGDLNVNYLADRVRQNPGLPTRALGDLVNFDMPLTGSRGETSLLDYGMTMKAAGGFAKVSSRIDYGYNSDHDAVVFTYSAVDLFATGPVFNRPGGSAAEQREVLARAVRAVGNAEPGARVRLAVSHLDDTELSNALIAAAIRGVAVQVVLAEGTQTGAEAAIQAAIGVDQAQPSWVKQCVGSCLGGAGKQQANFLLVDRAGGATTVSLSLNGSPLRVTGQAYTDAFLSTDPALYLGLDQTFDQMAADTADTRGSRQVTWGPSYAAQLYPMPAGVRDPLLKAVKRVRCKSGKNLVRVTARAMSGTRGRDLATALGKLREQGCDVRVVLGAKAKKIEKLLAASKVSVQRRAVSQNVLFVKGMWGKQRVTRAWVGGPDLTDSGLVSDGVTLIVNDGLASGYLAQFYRVFKGK